MCGIAGIFDPAGVTADDVRLVGVINDRQCHRGPDDAGVFVGRNCVLGHRRLAIIDLSRDGHQPMASPDGRFQLVFNGEIYNYLELRAELAKDWAFRTRTDTEVLLAACVRYGAECLQRLNGMFAFALYDALKGSLLLARDRLGVKPLYYAAKDGRVCFASEIKALYAIPGLSPTPDHQSLFDYLVFNRTDIHDETFTREIRRLPKGHYAVWGTAGPRLTRWWDPASFLASDHKPDPQVVAATVEELLISSVTLRMRSDVPVGSCLSGGLDSSILGGILFDRLGTPPGFPAFTAVYPGHRVDETAYIDAWLRRYPATSHRVKPDGSSALADFDALCWANDEPTTGCSIYAQYAVMRLARERGVVVLLDGQGGDENFAGYQYFHGFHLAGMLRRGRVAAFLKELAAVLRRGQEVSALQTLAYQSLPRPVRRLALLHATGLVSSDFFHAHIDHSRIEREFFAARDLNESLVLHLRYKLEHLLRTEDRNSMAFSLESRVPYLDYRLVEYLLATPAELKIGGGETKRLQKAALGHYTVPEILSRRDKIGFAAPSHDWMAEPAWREATQASLETLRRTFPGVLTRRAVPAGAEQCWKVNSLAAWVRLFLHATEEPFARTDQVT